MTHENPTPSTEPLHSPKGPAAPQASNGFLPYLAAAAIAVMGLFAVQSGKQGPVMPSGVMGSAPRVAVSDAVDASPIPSVPVATATLTPAMRSDIEALIKDYLVRNPEVMMEVQQALEGKMEKIQAEKSLSALKDHAKEIFLVGDQPSAGNPKGDVTLVEFFDYNCGYCKRALSDVMSFVTGDKNVRFVLKEFPILSKGSEEASRVAIAARKQGKYWDFHLAMLGLQGQANEASALKVAEKVGLDMARVKADMNAPDVLAEIKDTRALAEKMGISGTPHFLVGDKVIAGAPENLAEVLARDIGEVRKAGGCKVCGG